MKISSSDQNSRIINAIGLANNLLKDPEFYNAIGNHDSFDLASSNITTQIIANLILESSLVFNVKIFRPNIFQTFFAYRNTLAYTDEAHPRTVFLNAKKLNREPAEIAATIIHEAIHALDDEESAFSFGHGDNSPVGKENTAPYWIGNLAYRLLGESGNERSLSFDQ